MVITLEYLESLNPGELFKTSTFGLCGTVKRFVAVRGVALDWALYYGDADETPDEIQASGTKMLPTNKYWPVQASAGALSVYRY